MQDLIQKATNELDNDQELILAVYSMYTHEPDHDKERATTKPYPSVAYAHFCTWHLGGLRFYDSKDHTGSSGCFALCFFCHQIISALPQAL